MLRRVRGSCAQYFNTRAARSGHNPVCAGSVQHAAQYRWSSAAAHLSGTDVSGLLDLNWWRQQERGKNWAEDILPLRSPTLPLRCAAAPIRAGHSEAMGW